MKVQVKALMVGAVLTANVLGSMSTAFAASKTTRSTSSKYHHGTGMWNNGDLTKTLGISSATLQSDLKSGKSLVQIAATKHISESTLIKDLEADFKTQLNGQVKSGKLTAAKEKQMISNYDSHVKQMVEQKGFSHKSGTRGSSTK
jgi:hypothetical protein